MNRNSLRHVFPSLLLLAVLPRLAEAQDQNNQLIVPAGTLLRCTLDEPNFSSKTAEVGDPIVCPLSGVLLFDRTALPRGAYLGGHLEADKDPGRFFGKGYLKLSFDHIGLPYGEVPVPAKIIAARGYKVDKEGKVIGHGHATRDALEWMIPPLWPVKVLTLPRRGPRPALKGEEQLTLRLMDDIALPPQRLAAWRPFGKTSAQAWPLWNNAAPSRYVTPQAPPSLKPSTANNLHVAEAAFASPSSAASSKSATQYVLVLRNATTSVATSMHVDGDRLSYMLADGTFGVVSLEDVDWAKTFQSNAENGVVLALKKDQ